MLTPSPHQPRRSPRTRRLNPGDFLIDGVLHTSRAEAWRAFMAEPLCESVESWPREIYTLPAANGGAA
ncbi:MAG: hypothetical protein R3B90_16075 [Planctomycetaceae bacterium]